jgi:hypothetical protein
MMFLMEFGNNCPDGMAGQPAGATWRGQTQSALMNFFLSDAPTFQCVSEALPWMLRGETSAATSGTFGMH